MDCKIYKAFLYSLSGIKFLLQERAFVQELILGIILLVIWLCSQFTFLQSIYLFSSYCLVLITETLNTAIETVVNKISLEEHYLSKKAKDLGSAAVFISLVHLSVVLFFILFNK